jgi:hypothetical protein
MFLLLLAQVINAVIDGEMGACVRIAWTIALLFTAERAGLSFGTHWSVLQYFHLLQPRLGFIHWPWILRKTEAKTLTGETESADINANDEDVREGHAINTSGEYSVAKALDERRRCLRKLLLDWCKESLAQFQVVIFLLLFFSHLSISLAGCYGSMWRCEGLGEHHSPMAELSSPSFRPLRRSRFGSFHFPVVYFLDPDMCNNATSSALIRQCPYAPATDDDACSASGESGGSERHPSACSLNFSAAMGAAGTLFGSSLFFNASTPGETERVPPFLAFVWNACCCVFHVDHMRFVLLLL